MGAATAVMCVLSLPARVLAYDLDTRPEALNDPEKYAIRAAVQVRAVQRRRPRARRLAPLTPRTPEIPCTGCAPNSAACGPALHTPEELVGHAGSQGGRAAPAPACGARRALTGQLAAN